MLHLLAGDTAGIAALLSLAALQFVAGLCAGRWLWGRNANANRRRTGTIQESKHNRRPAVAGNSRTTRAGQLADELASIQCELALYDAAEHEEEQTTLSQLLTRMGDVNRELFAELQATEYQLAQQACEIESHAVDARTDALTGLRNRRAFDDELQAQLLNALHHNQPTSLMLVDVDHFKAFNDTYGHQAGDDVLRGVARVLYDCVPETNLVCRYGGEEFALILPGETLTNSQRIAEQLRLAVENASFAVDGRAVQLTVSSGLTPALANDTTESLLRRADEALYAAKAAGRNQAWWHEGTRVKPIARAWRVAEPNRSAADPSQTTREWLSCDVTADELPLDALLDAVTGLPRRRVFAEDLRRRLDEQRRVGTPLSLIALNIDAFSAINRSLGDDMGDGVLRAVSQFLAASVRAMDSLTRYQADEFLIMLPATSIAAAIQTAERMRQEISQRTVDTPAGNLSITVSIGVAEANDQDDAVSLVNRALSAIVRAKAAGGNCTSLDHAVMTSASHGIAPDSADGT
ncbi:MAG: GGDEF domain-containing protein [Planctomycetaceae bacterium]|nr:GGDEF domain-containing protein [Planctomycetaceae bacterium]